MELKAPGRYFSPWQVLVGAIIGGPLAGGFLIAADHSAFGAAGKGRLALMVSCLVIVAGVLLQGVFASRLDPADGSIVAGLVAGCYGVYAQVAFTADIARRRGLGWQPHTWGRTVTVSLGFFVAMITLVLLAAPQLSLAP